MCTNHPSNTPAGRTRAQTRANTELNARVIEADPVGQQENSADQKQAEEQAGPIAGDVDMEEVQEVAIQASSEFQAQLHVKKLKEAALDHHQR